MSYTRCGIVIDQDVNAVMNFGMVGKLTPNRQTPVDKTALSHVFHEATNLGEAGSLRGAMLTTVHS